MKMTASQIASMLGFEIKPWMAFEKVDGKTVSKLDDSKVGLRRGSHVDQERYLAQLTAFCKLTGLTHVGDVTKGGMFYWVAFDKAAVEAVSLEVLNLPVTVLQPSKPSPSKYDAAYEEEIKKAAFEEDSEDEDEIDEDEDTDEDEDEDSDGATA